MKPITQFIPLLSRLKNYTGKDVKADLLAGLTVGIMLVPQGMAYVYLAGMPPIYGLYTALVPLFLYGIFGSSPHLSIGPVAITSLLVLAGVSQIAEPFTPEYQNLVIITGLLVGIIQMLMGFVRLGFLVNFLSRPVVSGFISAAAIIIIINQLKDILGIATPRFPHLHQTLLYTFKHISQSNWISVVMGLGAIAMMYTSKRINKSFPIYLVVVVLGIGITALFSLDGYGLQIVGEVPSGLPSFVVPQLSKEVFFSLLFTTLIPVSLIGIVACIGIAKGLEAKHGDYKISSNQELIAIGIAKIGGAFFQAIPSSGSLSRSAVNSEAGARSGISSIFTALLILVSLLFLTPLFYYLPKSILAAIILMAVKALFDVKEAQYLWKTEKLDFWMWVITFFATLGIGIGEGVMVGISLSILLVLFKSSRPHVAELGNMHNSSHYRNLNRFEEATPHEEVLILRIDEQLYFANVEYHKEKIEEFLSKRKTLPKYVLLNAQSMHNIDSTGMHALVDIYHMLKKQQIQLVFSGVIGPVRDKMSLAGFTDLIGKENFFLHTHHAMINLIPSISGIKTLEWTDDAIQTNLD